MHASRRLALTLFLLGCGCAWLVLAAHRPPAPVKNSSTNAAFYFHHEHVIGTSLDLWLVTGGDEEQADKAEQVILEEIERLRRIFSTYDPESEISKLNRASGPLDLAIELSWVPLLEMDNPVHESSNVFMKRMLALAL